MKQYKRKIRQSTRTAYISIAIILLIVSLVSFVSTVFFKKSTINDKKAYSYDTNFNLKYDVNLKDNEFFQETTMPMNKAYVTAIIDDLDMTVKYDYKASRANDLTYTYGVKGILTGVYPEKDKEQKLLEREYILLEEETKSISSDEVNIEEAFRVNLKEYIQLIRDFEYSFGMDVNAEFKLIFTVQIKTSVNNQSIENKYVSDVNIRLGKKTTEVTGKFTDSKNSEISEQIASVDEINTFAVIIEIGIFIAGIMLLRYVYSKTVIARSIKSDYKVELNKILALCQDKIVQVRSPIEVNRGELVEVKDFGELIKLADEILKPIICWIDKQRNEAHFCVISGSISYRYILKE